jgi:hypothetical protein
MFGTVTAAVKIKALIAAFSLLLLGVGVYSVSDHSGDLGISAAAAKDPYTLDIQERSDLVNNAVLGVVDAQGKEEAWQFRTTCEGAAFIIRKKNLEAQQENLKLTPDQRALNVKYKAFLHEAYLVVDDCYQGKQADLSKMKSTKTKL